MTNCFVLADVDTFCGTCAYFFGSAQSFFEKYFSSKIKIFFFPSPKLFQMSRRPYRKSSPSPPIYSMREVWSEPGLSDERIVNGLESNLRGRFAGLLEA